MSENLLPNERDDQLFGLEMESALANALIVDLRAQIKGLEAHRDRLITDLANAKARGEVT